MVLSIEEEDNIRTDGAEVREKVGDIDELCVSAWCSQESVGGRSS